jgi:hypothetical protein
MSAPVPFDQALVTFVAGLLALIKVENGSNCNAGDYVLTEQTRADIPDEAVTLAIFDESESLVSGGQGYLRRRGELLLRVEGLLPVAKSSDTGPVFQPVREQARLLMADIRRAIAGRPEHDFPLGITGIRITGRLLPQLDDGASYQMCAVTFAFDFTESHKPKGVTP